MKHEHATKQNPPQTEDRLLIAQYDWSEAVGERLAALGIKKEDVELFIRAFKGEKVMELWVKSKSAEIYVLYKSLKFCAASGKLGPKREQGDRQVPEGVYHIQHFNPKSRFWLSLGINYPNVSDKILGTAADLGGEIYIHGDCQSIGCIAMGDRDMSEIYVLADMARKNGQAQISVHIFPLLMTDENLKENQPYFSEHIAFWMMLRPVYAFFEKNKKLPLVEVGENGSYVVRDK